MRPFCWEEFWKGFRKGSIQGVIIALLVITIYLLAGCGVKTVYVPVSSCPTPPAFVMPVLALDNLPKKPDTAAALKAMGEDYVTLKGSLEQCIIILDGYRKKEDAR